MKLYWNIIVVIFFSNFLGAQQVTERIHIDQFGYLPEAEKVAVLSDPQIGFNSEQHYSPGSSLQVRNHDNEVVYEGDIVIWDQGNIHTQSGDRGWWFDFTEVIAPGTYHIYDPVNQVKSYDFLINENVYGEIMKVAGRMFYYNRCNFPKEQPFAHQNWEDSMNFNHDLQDANCRYVWDRTNPSTEKDLTGGWFDAGDYNKYVTFAHNVIHDLLSAYEENPQAFTDQWNIPESGNSIPDILDEIKYELEWLMKMQMEDGSVIIKMGSIDHGDNAASPPSVNTDPRYYGPTCTSSTIAVASMFAHAYLVFKEEAQLADFANELKEKAELAWSNVSNNLLSGNLDTGCDDGTIKAGDADWSVENQKANALTAAAYLFMSTNNNMYQQYLSDHIMDAPIISGNWWGPYTNTLNEALLKYAVHENGLSELQTAILERPQNHVNENWDGFYGFNQDDLYRAFVPTWAYHWGSNNVKAQFASLNLLMVKYDITEDTSSFIRKAAEQLHYFHGVNPLGMVQLSNMYAYGAEVSANEIYHTWFNDNTPYDNSLTSDIGPAPGYVVGGANKDFSIGTIQPPSNQPAQKSYLDWNTGWPENSWEITEPAIYYQSAYIRLLANFVSNDSSTPVIESDAVEEIICFPNPANDILLIPELPEGGLVKLFDINGKEVVSSNKSSLEIDFLPAGNYVVVIFANGKKFKQQLVIAR